MKEIPILFSTPMVQATLENRKTMTRRICKDANDFCEPLNDFIDNEKRTYAIQNYGDIKHTDFVSMCEVKMPICVGDVLWVKETWAQLDMDYKVVPGKLDMDEWKGCPVVYRADCPDKQIKWRSSRFMPKSAARIWLEVTGVKVERLQDITINQIKKEGIYFGEWRPDPSYIEAFSNLWNATLKTGDIPLYGWSANPWVWVISFRRVES